MAERKTGSQMDSGLSAVDLSAKNRLFCKRTAGGINLAGAGENVAGVIIEGKKAGLHTSFATGNQVKVIAAAALAVGTKVMCDAASKAAAATAGNHVVGVVIRPSTGADTLCTIDIDRSQTPMT